MAFALTLRRRSGEGGPNYDEYRDWAMRAGAPVRGAYDVHHKGGQAAADSPDARVIASRDLMFCGLFAPMINKLKDSGHGRNAARSHRTPAGRCADQQPLLTQFPDAARRQPPSRLPSRPAHPLPARTQADVGPDPGGGLLGARLLDNDVSKNDEAFPLGPLGLELRFEKTNKLGNLGGRDRLLREWILASIGEPVHAHGAFAIEMPLQKLRQLLLAESGMMRIAREEQPGGPAVQILSVLWALSARAAGKPDIPQKDVVVSMIARDYLIGNFALWDTEPLAYYISSQ